MLKHLNVLSITVIVCLFIIQLLLSNRLATRGEELSRLNQQISELRQRNDNLKQEISEASALDKIATQAAELGLIPTTQALNIFAPQPVAMNQ